MPIFVVDRYGMPVNMRTYNPTPTPTPLLISVVDHNLPYDFEYNVYDVTFDSDVTIQTILTSSPSHVDAWLTETLRLHHSLPFIVGLDIEWRPNTQPGVRNPVATLQLCVNRRCLVFQIIHAPFISNFLRAFLVNRDHRFVGVGIEADVQKLLEDYSIRVANFVDLRSLASDVLGDCQLMSTGLKALAQRLLGKDIEKPQRITRSRWDNEWLSADQVQYATVDAYVSFEIGRRLYSNRMVID